MRKVYLTETQLKNYIRLLAEEEYTLNYRIGPFQSENIANAELEHLRREMGFSKYDSWTEGNFIILALEKDLFDDDYIGDMITSLKKQYGKVAESRD